MWCIRKLRRRAGRHGAIAPVVAAVLVPALLVQACGFRPLHGERAGGEAGRLAAISIGVIPDRLGQKFRNLLLDRLTPLGPPAQPQYVLSVTLSEGLQSLGLRKDATATRANLTISANFTLVRVGDKTARYSASAFSTNSYNILESDFATLSARINARDRALRSLSEDIRTRLARALANPAFLRRPEPEPQSR
jgi:LPS-assembly lipoprotein